jgi:hypothetical protein
VTPNPVTFDLTNLDSNPTIMASPVLTVKGPRLSTQLIYGTFQDKLIYLQAQLQPQAQAGIDMSLKLAELGCELQFLQWPIEAGLLPGGPSYQQLIAQHIRSDVQSKAENLLESSGSAVLASIPGVVTAAQQVTQIAKAFSTAEGLACLQGSVVAENEEATAELVVAALVVAPVVAPAAGSVIATLAGRLLIFPVLGPAAAAASSVTVGQTAAPVPTSVHRIAARTVRPNLHSLRRAPFPQTRGGLLAALREVQLLATPIRVGRLLISGRLAPGHRVTVIAAKLPSVRPHRAAVMLIGPGYFGQHLLKEHDGLAGASIQLPKHMAPGAWILVISDDGKVSLSGKRVKGISDLRLSRFQVTAPRHR